MDKSRYHLERKATWFNMKIRNLRLRHALHELRAGFLMLPGLVMFAIAAAGVALATAEEHYASQLSAVGNVPGVVPRDPAIAQLLLGAIAGSAMTVISVVYSVLLMALTFASLQFSPRILTSFVKDRVSQVTLGMFTGTFAYCMILLPHIHGEPTPFVPIISITGAIVLTAACLIFLLYFIHHIALSIQANHIVNRIANETESVLRTLFGSLLVDPPIIEPNPEPPMEGAVVNSTKSGYIRFIDEQRLLEIAEQNDAFIFVYRSVGQFIPAGTPCIKIVPEKNHTETIAHACLSAFEVGPMRSMELDVEFGILQIVDIALKALSPAVNDPSTAIGCIDQLSRIMAVAAVLTPPTHHLYDASGKLRVSRRQTSFPRLLEIAFNQIRPHGKDDMAVSLRLLRALQDISGVTQSTPYLEAILDQAQRVITAAATCFPPEECNELYERFSIIEIRAAGSERSAEEVPL